MTERSTACKHLHLHLHLTFALYQGDCSLKRGVLPIQVYRYNIYFNGGHSLCPLNGLRHPKGEVSLYISYIQSLCKPEFHFLFGSELLIFI